MSTSMVSRQLSVVSYGLCFELCSLRFAQILTTKYKALSTKYKPQLTTDN